MPGSKPVGRFQVMAILQAARASYLGLSEELSKSWGLNRAIFYAAAKRGFKTFRMKRPVGGIPRVGIAKRYQPKEEVFQLGDEMAYRVKKGDTLYFTIGGEAQTEEDFDRQIASRFAEEYQNAWNEALKIIKKHPKSILLSQNEFFQQAYKPIRDELSKKWSEMVLSRWKETNHLAKRFTGLARVSNAPEY